MNAIDSRCQRPRERINAGNIPQPLRASRQFCVWTGEYDPAKNKWSKCPKNARTGGNAMSNNSDTWSSYAEAEAALLATDQYEGIMFALTESAGIVGIDIDECRASDGTITPGAMEIIRKINSYTEVSPSGTGVKIYCLAKKRCDGAMSKLVDGTKEVEVYSTGKFFAVTGEHLEGTPKTIEYRQQEFDELCEQLFPPKPVRPQVIHIGEGFPGDDWDLVSKASQAQNGARFKALMAGDTSAYGGDHSAADLGLCNHLAWWTGKDASRMDRIFRMSGLMRPKWDERRPGGTYGSDTIDKAIADCGETYSASPKQKPSPAVAANNDSIEAGKFDPETGKLILDPQRTLITAKTYRETFYGHPDCCRLVYQDEQLYEWRDNRYVPVESTTLRQAIHRWLTDALAIHVNPRNGNVYLCPFRANPKSVQSVFEAICLESHVPHSSAPIFWRDARADRPPANEIVCCKSVNLHIASGDCFAPTPLLFNKSALEFDYDPNAPPPPKWLAFLDQLFSIERDMIGLLQEVMGYCLGPDTGLQKILMFNGPRRAGKGVTADILSRLAGKANVAAPTIEGLTQQFALQSFYDKPLAIVSDARFTSQNLDIVLERLLSISGEGLINVDRKYLCPITAKIPTRFLILTNDLPVFKDASNALAGRLVIVRFKESFLGKENPGLVDELVCELPGILNWAIVGFRRLRANRAFSVPAGNASLIGQIEELNSPVKCFVDDHCVIDPLGSTPKRDMYERWCFWVESRGAKPTSDAVFGRDLASAFPQLTTKRLGKDKVAHYVGISLKEGVE